MREWWVWYYGDALRSYEEPKLHRTGELKAPHFDGFREAAAAGQLGDRDIASMWIRDPHAENDVLIAWCGKKPPTDRREGGGYIGPATIEVPMTDRRPTNSRRGGVYRNLQSDSLELRVWTVLIVLVAVGGWALLQY